MRLYALLELAVAAMALASPYLLEAVRWLYFASGGAMALGWSGATVVRLLLSVCVLGVPTVLMGGTLPPRRGQWSPPMIVSVAGSLCSTA